MLKLYEIENHYNIFKEALRSNELEEVYAHPFTGAFGQQYYPAVFECRRQNVSFVIKDYDRPVLITLCSVGEDNLDWYGMPVRVFTAKNINMSVLNKSLQLAIGQLENQIRVYNVKQAKIIERITNGNVTPLGKACLVNGWEPQIIYNGYHDINKDEAYLKKNMRKSYKSLVNWGIKNMTLKYFNSQNQDASIFNDYQNFHRVVSGKITRNQKSWDIMYDWIRQGHGEISLASIEDKVIAATMIIDGAHTAYYASGVYARENFDKPMAHYPLYNSILRASSRNLKNFDLGYLSSFTIPSKKENDIFFFKRGFSTCIAGSIIWNKCF